MTSKQLQPLVKNDHYFLGSKGGRCTKVWLYLYFEISLTWIYKARSQKDDEDEKFHFQTIKQKKHVQYMRSLQTSISVSLILQE